MCRASTEQKASATGIYCRNIERQGISASGGSTENENGLAQRDIAFYSPRSLDNDDVWWLGRWRRGC